MKPLIRSIACVLAVYSCATLALPTPPAGKKWEKIENLSDEFNNGFDTKKWIKNDPQWAGRKPGLFKKEQVSVAGGNLRITADILPPNERLNGWTHAGGLVRSATKVPASFSGYFEARMKANKTFLSSTFWLINKRNEGQGCDFRTTELDITETVGFNSGGHRWIDNNMRRMNSNTHSRGVSCGEPVSANGGGTDLGGLASANYHTYGAWWKSPNEIIFFLDGAEKFRITPPYDFSLDMYLRMVVETYDWNPPPADGGMQGSFQDRTTYYDWVRSYRLVDDDGGDQDGSVTMVPGKVQAEDYTNAYDTTAGNSGGVYRNDNVDVQPTTDLDGGYNVGWIDSNEWLEFPINVTQAGEYRADARVASVSGNGMFTLEVGGVTKGDAVSVGATGGWQSWQTKSSALGQLSAGDNTLRVQVQNGGFNLNWIDIVRTGNGDNQCRLPYTNPGVSISNETASWSTGPIDINCATNLTISMAAQGLGPMENADYLNVFYRVNGGDKTPLFATTGAFAERALSVNSISGTTLEVIVEAKTSYSDETYQVSNIRIDGNTIGSVDQCDTTQQCKNLFGNAATDCLNSRSSQSVCMCGSAACN